MVSVLYSTEKEAWLNEVIVEFEKTNPIIDGHPVKIELEKMGSWEINAAVLDGTRQPDIVSPASTLQIAALVDSPLPSLVIRWSTRQIQRYAVLL